MEVRVVSETGQPVNFRAAPSTSGKILAKLKEGTAVNKIQDFDPVWCFVSYEGVNGYMMSQYLEETEGKKEDHVILAIDRDTARRLYKALGAAL